MLQSPGPAWFTRWTEEIEPRASVLRTWDPLLVPGLFQTEDYARSVFLGAPGITADEVDERVRARVRRGAILDGEVPPMVWALSDEYVLRRPVAAPETMRRQLEIISDLTRRPNITVQIVAPQCTTGMRSGFMIAQLGRGQPDTVNVESLGG
ncbi:hypothetical protein Ssi03_18620 [Sphaerisporangium siamense]|uniref:DUF5753 domain-containing protein n=1 Tax=Sphaerisporangium siamense TaxID=795645 RepID=A0A7W7DG20_9ACTN|nr:DUF5753 domain-containing protein [Sphaerisporangium siamense]MBB4705066.1 hypothetical protein [Sphaerisporangium siamense]GII83872.1 hypothetical protein Ssi03_18620 [Sphaerisporangium siamense]